MNKNKVPITEHMDYEIVCSGIKILYQCIPILENKLNTIEDNFQSTGVSDYTDMRVVSGIL